MAVLNLRGIDDELAAQLKSRAALAGLGYHEYCVGILACAMRVGEGVEIDSSKKIADVNGGGGGTPCLPPTGKRDVGEDAGRGENRGLPDMEKLRAICAGDLQGGGTGIEAQEYGEVEMCGYSEYDQVSGETMHCGKDKHGARVKHGNWYRG